MKIKIGKYLITHDPIARGFFNLSLTGVVSDPKSKNIGKVTESPVAYSIRLSRAMDIIASKHLEDKQYKDIIDYVKQKEVVINDLLEKFNKNSKLIYTKLSNDGPK